MRYQVLRRSGVLSVVVATVVTAALVALPHATYGATPGKPVSVAPAVHARTVTKEKEQKRHVRVAVRNYNRYLDLALAPNSFTKAQKQRMLTAPLDRETYRLARKNTKWIIQAYNDAGSKIVSTHVTSSVKKIVFIKSHRKMTVRVSMYVDMSVTGIGVGATDSGFSVAYKLTVLRSGGHHHVVASKMLNDDVNSGAYGSESGPLPGKSDESSSTRPSSRDASSRVATDDRVVARTESGAPATTGVPWKGYPQEGLISGSKFEAYADKWTGGPYKCDDKACFNPAYPYYSYPHGSDCANFVSQVLNQSGWYTTRTLIFQIHNPNKWTYNNWGPGSRVTRTWSSAPDLFNFAKKTGTYQHLPNIWGSTVGTLLFVNWGGPHGEKTPDLGGTKAIDHVMAVVARGSVSGVPYISQKSPNRHRVPLTLSILKAHEEGYNQIIWYGLMLTVTLL